MSDLALFVVGFGVFALCIGGTLGLAIGSSQPPARKEKYESVTSNPKVQSR